MALLRRLRAGTAAGALAVGTMAGSVQPAEAAASGKPARFSYRDPKQAPELTGLDGWVNSSPLTLASLRGKVVLVDFWTFACINCQRTLPYVKQWYERYHDQGFEIVGVHTPELSFERDPANVRMAVTKLGLRFPVALDPGFATWNAYRNNYWPALYFLDKTGRIRHLQIGEGSYDNSERVIQALLAEPAKPAPK